MHFPLKMKANLFIKKLHKSMKSPGIATRLVAIMSLGQMYRTAFSSAGKTLQWNQLPYLHHRNQLPTHTTFSRVSVPWEEMFSLISHPSYRKAGCLTEHLSNDNLIFSGPGRTKPLCLPCAMSLVVSQVPCHNQMNILILSAFSNFSWRHYEDL